ncbi:hypothetical protein Tco_0815315, partial [Tanacetum coccineum]
VKGDIAIMVADAVKKEPESIRAELSMHVTNDVANTIKDDEQARDADLSIWLSLKIKFEKPAPLVEPCRITVVRTRDHEDHHDDDAHLEGESSAKKPNTSKHGTYTTGESSSSQEMNESTPFGEEHQYHLDQMQHYMKNQIVWEGRKEDLTLQILEKPVLVYDSYERDPKAPPMTLLN